MRFSHPESLSEINVTPLVDVMLVLLIIFMVTAPMIRQGVDVNLPKANTPAMADDATRLIVTVDRKGDVFIGKERVPKAGLAERLKVFAGQGNLKEAFMRADRDVTVGSVTEVMNAMRKAGIKRVGMVTEPLVRR